MFDGSINHRRSIGGLTLVVALLVATLTWLTSPVARAVDEAPDEEVDQQQPQFSGAFIGAASNQVVAQSFTAGKSGVLTRVSLHGHLQNSPAPGDMVVEIRHADAGGLPTGAALATATVPAELFAPFDTKWFDAGFATPATVSAGSKYAIVVSSTTASTFETGIYYLSEVSTGNVYPGGTMSVNGTIFNPAEDLTFKTYVAPDLESDGTLDPSFGTGGVVTTKLLPSAGPGAAVLQPDGKLVVVGGRANPHDAVVARYLPNGSLDTGFGDGGIREVDFGPGNIDGATAVALQADGKIVVAGGTRPSATAAGDSMVFRLTANGSIDSTFSDNGRAPIAVSSTRDDRAEAIVVQPDGKILVAGGFDHGGNGSMYVFRLNAGGALDTAFGSSGIRTHLVGASTAIKDLLLQPDGKMVTAGFYATGAGHDDITLVRLTPSGSLDATWGASGTVRTAVGSSHDRLFAIALDPTTGTIVGAGHVYEGGLPRFALVRYRNDGSLDTTFGNGGKVVTSLGSEGTFYAITRQANGKIVAAGEVKTVTYDMAVLRYTAAGAADPTFGTDGAVTKAIGGAGDHAHAVVVQPDNRIVAVGPYDYGGNAAFALLRYWRNSNNTPVVTVGGVADGSTYEYGGVPDATCLVNDVEDGTKSFPATVTGPALGSRTASCTYTDAGGATASATTTFTVTDTTGPAFTTPVNAVAEATSAAGAAVSYSLPTASDAFDGAVNVSCSPAPGAPFPLGATTVTCSAIDSHNNPSSTQLTVTVVDTTGPQLPPLEQITAEATSGAGAVVTFAMPDAVDLVSGAVPTLCTPGSGSAFALGTIEVTCHATDQAGIRSTGTFAVVVQDRSAPVVGVPASPTIEATSPAGASVDYGAVSATDAVDGTIATTCNPTAGSTFALGSTTVACTATDTAGNTGSGSFSVTVKDTTAPTLQVSGNVTGEATSPSGAAVDFAAATAHDAVDTDVTPTCTADPGNTLPLGITVVECSAVDGTGNLATASFSVTVVDTIAPTMADLVNVTVEATSPAGAPANYQVPAAQDAVSLTVPLNCMPASGSVFAVGDTTVECTATDGSGNTSARSFTVHVVDTTPPVLTMPANQTAAAADAAGATVSYPAPSGVDVVDGLVAVSCTPPTGSPVPAGRHDGRVLGDRCSRQRRRGDLRRARAGRGGADSRRAGGPRGRGDGT